jgi:hypothetical protein
MYYKRKHCVGEEVVGMVILSCAVCLSLGACLGFLGAGLCATASDKPQCGLNAKATPMGRGWESSKAMSASGSFFEGKKPLARLEQVRGKSDARYATADTSD